MLEYDVVAEVNDAYDGVGGSVVSATMPLVEALDDTGTTATAVVVVAAVEASVLVLKDAAVDEEVRVVSTIVELVAGATVGVVCVVVSAALELVISVLLTTVDVDVVGAGVLDSGVLETGADEAAEEAAVEATEEAAALLEASLAGAFLHKLCGPSPARNAEMMFSPPMP